MENYKGMEIHKVSPLTLLNVTPSQWLPLTLCEQHLHAHTALALPRLIFLPFIQCPTYLCNIRLLTTSSMRSHYCLTPSNENCF